MPEYFAALTMVLVVGMVLTRVFLIAFIPFYMLRSRAEEKMMLEKFGDSYCEYQKTTGSLLPKW